MGTVGQIHGSAGFGTPGVLSTTAQPELFHGYRNGHYADDANDHRLGSRCDRHGAQQDARSQVHAHGRHCGNRKHDRRCTNQDFDLKLQAHAPRLGPRSSDGACARRAGSRRDRYVPGPYVRNPFHGHDHGFRDGETFSSFSSFLV